MAKKNLIFSIWRTMSAHKRQWAVPGLMVLILLSGYGWVQQSVYRAENILRSDLLSRASSVARTINREQLGGLTFTAEDATRSEFQGLCSQMRACAEALGLRSLYSMALRDGRIVFGPESLPVDDPYASPPGTVYEQPSPEDFEIFTSAKASVQGPRTDEYGTFVTALVPVLDPRTGGVLMVIGLDVEMTEWQAALRETWLVPGLFTAGLLAMLLAGALLTHKNPLKAGSGRIRRYAEVIISAAILLTLTAVAAWISHDTERRSRRETFISLAGAQASGIVRELGDLRERIKSLQGLFKAGAFVDRGEFREYTKGFTEDGFTQCWMWIPAVPSTGTAQFAASVRRDGTAGFSIWQQNEKGEREPAAGRNAFYPVLYIEPLAGHMNMPGYDLGSDPERCAAIEETLRTEMPVATGPDESADLTGGPDVFCVMQAVRSARQKGVVAVTIDPNALMRTQTYKSGMRETGLPMELFLLECGRPPRFLAGSSELCSQDCWKQHDGFSVTVPVFIFGKSYVLLVHPGHGWMAAHPLRNGWQTGVSGLIISALLTALFAPGLKRRRILEEEVAHRTAALREHEETIRSMFKAAPIGIGKTVNRILKEVNETLCEMTGYTRDELLDQSARMFYPNQEEFDFVGSEKYRQISEKGTGTVETRWVCKDGRIIDVLLSSSLLDPENPGKGTTFTALDISARKKAESELLRLSIAIEQAAEIIVITDLQGIIQYINPAFEAATGYSRSEAVGQNPRILKSGKHSGDFYRELWHTITSGQTWTGRFINRRKDGEFYTEETVISPVRNAQGAIINFVAVKRDITGEINMEEYYRQAQKMEAVGRLAGGVAHDFNNILQVILGFSELLMDETKARPAEHRSVEEIQKAAHRAAELTGQLLTFSRKQAPEFATLNINDSVRSIGGMLRRLIGENLRYVDLLDPELKKVNADPGQIEQIIINLAINARDAMPNGGRLTIRTENIVLGAKDAAAYPEKRRGEFVCLSLTDTGTGIDSEVRKHLFEPFFTTKAIGKGTGLGLAIIYGIVKQHNGWISVYSEAGQGSTFKVYLPVSPAEAAGKTASPGKALFAGKKNGRVLLVEDEAIVRTLCIRLLQDAGCQVFAAGDFDEAQALFTGEKGRFDLLFSDIILPRKNGIELADTLRREKPDLAVILCSGYRDEHDRWSDLREKGYLFLPKPFTVNTLIQTLEQALNNVP